MPSTSNVVEIQNFRRPSEESTTQELIDDIGARAFLFIRDEAEAMNIPVKDVIAEHMLGLTMVIESVEGCQEARRLLAELESKLSL